MNTLSALVIVSLLFVGCQQAKKPSVDLQNRDLVSVVRQECSKSESGQLSLHDYEGMVKFWDSIRVLSVPQDVLDSICREADPLLLIESGGTRGYMYKCWMVAECTGGPICFSVAEHAFGRKPDVAFFALGPEQFTELESSIAEGLSDRKSHSEFDPWAIDGSYEIVTLWDGQRPRYFLSRDLRLARLEESSSLRWLSALADTVFWSQERTRKNAQ